MGSAIVHIVGLIVLFAVRASSALVVPGADVIQVQLVQANITPLPAPVEPAPRPPEREALAIKPVEEIGVKLTPPERPKPKQKEPEAKPAPPERVGTALPNAQVGPAGLTGSLSVDASDFEFTYYLLLVRNRVAQNWEPPTGLVTSGEPVRAIVYFKILRDGTLAAPRLEQPSGREYFDRSTVRAVLLSDPLPPLPAGFDGTELGVHFGFEYAGP
jgi:protein TonB